MSTEGKKKLQEKLKKDIEGGHIALSSQDMATFEPGDTPEKREPVVGDVSVKAPDSEKRNTLIAAGAEGAEKVLAGQISDAAPARLAPDPNLEEFLSKDTLKITEANRNAFIEAIITGDRFETPFSIFNGKVLGVIRSRTQAESNAIVARLGWESRQNPNMNMLEYSNKVRNFLLAAQIKIVMDEEYEPIQEPYLTTIKGEETKPPGWLDQVEIWNNKNEGLVLAVYEQLKIFEKKYWVMVENADEQNFWNPVESS